LHSAQLKCNAKTFNEELLKFIIVPVANLHLHI